MKVLFLANNLEGGGAERVLVNLLDKFDFTKYSVTLRVLVDEGINKENLPKDICYEYIFKRNFRGLNYLHLLPPKFIYNKIAKGSFDVIIVYLHGVLTKIVSYAPQTQKTIAYLHANMNTSPFMRSFKTLKRKQNCFMTFDAIVSVSKEVQDSFIKQTNIVSKLHIINNTFDLVNIRKLSVEPCDIEIKNEIDVRIISVGKLNKVKGYLRLLSVVNRLIQENESLRIKLIIVGNGPEEEALKNFVEDNNLKEVVQLIGFDSNPYKYIANSDLFVCASYTEGFSSVVVESIILGVPVITTDCPGMKDILGENNEYGLIVENNTESLFNGLKEMIVNEKLRIHYQKKAVLRSSYFESNRSVKEVEALIKEVINSDS